MSAVLVLPDRQPTLFFFQPEDYWYLPPADPEPWWADHFRIEVVRDVAGWRQGMKDALAAAGIAQHAVAAIGDSPSLSGEFEADRVNPQGLVDRIHLARTRKTAYEVACIDAAARLQGVPKRVRRRS